MLSNIRHAWNRLWTIARPFREYDHRWWAVGVFGILIALLLTVAGLNYAINKVFGHFMGAVQRQDAGQFSWRAIQLVGVFATITLVQVMSTFTEQRLGLMLREGLTQHLIRRYLTDRIYYRLTTRPDIDNPDQRITEDVKN